VTAPSTDFMGKRSVFILWENDMEKPWVLKKIKVSIDCGLPISMGKCVGW